MHRFPCIHAKEEAHKVSFASPLSRAFGFFRLVFLQVLLPLPSLLALFLKLELEGDLRRLLLADLTAMRFWLFNAITRHRGISKQQRDR